MKKKFDVVALGELLIDFTQNGLSAQGNPLFEANPGGAPCNVLAMLKKLGKSFEEVCEEIEKYKDTLRLYFGLRSLHNLAQNGRVSKIVASAIGFMNIRILGTASKEGTIQSVAKCRGDKKLVETTLSEIRKAGYKGGKIRICHVESAQLAQALEDQLRSEYGAIDIKTIPARGLCSFYAERGGFILGCEC